MFLTTDLPPNKKMDLYNATIQGDLSLFKNLILNLKYPLFEEISASSHFWTPLHYAMHYGQASIIFFIFELLSSTGKLEAALLLTSADGRCPLLCLLRSNTLDNDKKRSLLVKIFQNFKFNISNLVRKEMTVRKMEDIIPK